MVRQLLPYLGARAQVTPLLPDRDPKEQKQRCWQLGCAKEELWGASLNEDVHIPDLLKKGKNHRRGCRDLQRVSLLSREVSDVSVKL